MVATTHDYLKKAVNLIKFIVNAPADSEIKVEFEYKVDHRTGITIKR